MAMIALKKQIPVYGPIIDKVKEWKTAENGKFLIVELENGRQLFVNIDLVEVIIDG